MYSWALNDSWPMKNSWVGMYSCVSESELAGGGEERWVCCNEYPSSRTAVRQPGQGRGPLVVKRFHSRLLTDAGGTGALQAVPVVQLDAGVPPRPSVYEWCAASGCLYAAGGAAAGSVYVWDLHTEICTQTVRTHASPPPPKHTHTRRSWRCAVECLQLGGG
jgi:hypothetical protein